MTSDLSRWIDRVTCGDCLEVLRELPDCSVDLCATDPPYALTSGTGASGGFMGKAWDAALPARAIWAEVLRVLKPGASCFVCAGSRQDTILGLLTDLREVGFDIQHAALTWTYATGFPKSTDVGKDMDKAAFLRWLREVPPGETETRQALMGWDAADVRKAASAAVNGAYSATVPESRVGRQRGMAHFTGDQTRPYEVVTHATETAGTLLLAALQARFGDAPGVRAKVGVSSDSANRSAGSMATGNHNPTGYNIHPEGERIITAPATPDAIAWDGWHSSSVPLKPASEQILWLTKPSEPGPARGNVLKWGVGACNIGACRVPFAGVDDYQTTANKDHREVRVRYAGDGGLMNTAPAALAPTDGPHFHTDASGRYPSNLLVTARALGDDSKYGDIDAWARERGLSGEWLDAALSAGVLRVSKPSRSEKNAGCEGLEEKAKPLMNEWTENPGRTTPKQSATPRANHHPTTKPLTLFAFLCTLACPRGGTVLDPFGGSGTTGVAAIACGMHWILCEREAEYCTIAEARTEHAKQQARRAHQPALAIQEAAE